MSQNNNPLSQYFRQVKLTTPLPTKCQFYPENFIEKTLNGEVEVMGLTALDELNFKNPDLLINGQAMIKALKSCVPTIENPAKLYVPDVNALMVAIRIATNGEDMELDITCPKCKEEEKEKVESFKMDISLRHILDSMNFHKSEYTYKQPDGPVLYLTPFRYDVFTQTNIFEFEFQKIIQYAKDSTLQEEEKLKKISKPIEKMAQVHIDMIAESVIKIEVNGQSVTNSAHIKEYIKNIDKKHIENIKKIIEEVNQVGISTSIKCKCPKCSHEWTNEQIPFDPSYFFG